MLQRYAICAKLVKTPKQKDAPEEASKKPSPEQFSHVVKEQTKNAALLIGATYTIKVVVDTAQAIALHVVKTKIK